MTIRKIRSKISLLMFILIISIPLTSLADDDIKAANTYYSAQGFDRYGNDGQPDYVDTGTTLIFGVKVPMTNYYIQSNLGGIAAPLAYSPNIVESITKEGLSILIGDGTYALPQSGSALEYRSILYANEGVNALKAFYTNAIQAFTPALNQILSAEELFRTALRVNPFYKDALDGLLETYYARAEGFILIGNEYMAKAYQNKYFRNPNEQLSITDLELKDIESALISYEVGFREFIKLFNEEFIGVGEYRKPHLDINPDWLFFERRYPNPNGDGLVSFESLRGQENAIGHCTKAIDSQGKSIAKIQGSPDFEAQIAVKITKRNVQSQKRLIRKSMSQKRMTRQIKELDSVDAQVKFQTPVPENVTNYQQGSLLKLRFELDSTDQIQTLEMLIEFDHEKLDPPSNLSEIDFSNSYFGQQNYYYRPGEIYQGVKLYANQLLIITSAETSVSGLNKTVASVPFHIKSAQQGDFYVYVSGSGGSLTSGFKDIAILYRLASSHAYATKEKVKRIYSAGNDSNNCIEFIDKELARLGGWNEHIQYLLAESAKDEELKRIENFQAAINSLSAELQGLSNLKAYIRSGANEYGYPNDYVPFYDSESSGNSFDTIRNLVIGGVNFTAGSAGGFFGIAREAETQAVITKEKFDTTKDRIRSELFTINSQTESRLLQICGRINNVNNPSLNVKDPIDYDLVASHKNLACEIGQNVELLKRAKLQLEQSNEDIKQYLQDIELEKNYLLEAIKKKQQSQTIMAEYGELQRKLDIKISQINARQIRLNAIAEAASMAVKSQNLIGWFSGEAWSSGAAAAIVLANGFIQADLEERKGKLQAEKTQLSTQERIQLTQIDTELFVLDETKRIEQMTNDIVIKSLSAEISSVDVNLALGRLNQLIAERDELLAKRGRSLANLGEMSFADPSFRLFQFNAMKEAEIQLDYLKKWLFVMTRALYYKWALKDDYTIYTDKGSINIHDINRIQIVGALNEGISVFSVLQDTMSATKYIETLIAFDNSAPMHLGLSHITMDKKTSNNSSRFSIREDFLRIVRSEESAEETKKLNEQFKKWLTSPDRLDSDGNLVIEFNTIEHLENYDLPVNENYGNWSHFSLRSYSNKPLWNHKISKLGVALQHHDNVFKSGVANISASIEFGGTGYVKQNTNVMDDFVLYQMRQWRDKGNNQFEPINYRTVALTIPSSMSFEDDETSYLQLDLKERPVAATNWRLVILKSQLNNVYLENIEDIFIYIYSEAYQSQ